MIQLSAPILFMQGVVADKNVVTTATIRQSLSAVLQQQTNGLLNKANINWGRQPSKTINSFSPAGVNEKSRNL